MGDCIFCRIIKCQLPSSIVYEDNLVLAFLDIHPINEGHVLIVPKEHQEKFTQLTTESVGQIFKVAQKILNAIEKSEIRSEAANIFLSDGKVAGQEVMHSHLHIAPRFRGDGQRIGFSHANSTDFSREHLDSVAQKISQQLKKRKEIE